MTISSHFCNFQTIYDDLFVTSLYNSVLNWPEDPNLFRPVCKKWPAGNKNTELYIDTLNLVLFALQKFHYFQYLAIFVLV